MGRAPDHAGTDDSRIIETHVSRLFFVGDRVYKSKLPVRNDFLDFTTVAARQAACWNEVELNRRLAPESYLGVLDILRDGEPVDHVVEMVRHPTTRRLSNLLDTDEVHGHLRDVARRVVELHRLTRGDSELAASAGAEAVAAVWRDELDGIAPFVGSVIDPDEAARVEALVTAAIEPRGPMFAERVRTGAGVDGHGDLQSEDIFCVDGGVQILDCLEFDDSLRHGDVVADVGFLAMDLERRGHPELAGTFLDEYRRLSGDRWPVALEHLYIAERAHVRAKVACLRHATATARELHRLAADHLAQARPLLVLVGGAPGTGKSTIARSLGAELEAVVLSSDELRDDVVGPTEPGASGAPAVPDRGRYRPDAVDQVYGELLDRAALALARGERVVLDASWTDEHQRAGARSVGARAQAAVVELCAVAPVEVAAARVERRRRTGGDASEATAEVARVLAARRDPWPSATELDTTAAPPDVADSATRVVRDRLAESL